MKWILPSSFSYQVPLLKSLKQLFLKSTYHFLILTVNNFHRFQPVLAQHSQVFKFSILKTSITLKKSILNHHWVSKYLHWNFIWASLIKSSLKAFIQMVFTDECLVLAKLDTDFVSYFEYNWKVVHLLNSIVSSSQLNSQMGYSLFPIHRMVPSNFLSKKSHKLFLWYS